MARDMLFWLFLTLGAAGGIPFLLALREHIPHGHVRLVEAAGLAVMFVACLLFGIENDNAFGPYKSDRERMPWAVRAGRRLGITLLDWAVLVVFTVIISYAR